MFEFDFGEQNFLSLLKPNSIVGAAIYLLLFVLAALLISRLLRTTLNAAVTRQNHLDRTTVNFLSQFGSALVWIVALILYAQLIPQLRALGTALLAGASIASVVIGLAAQSTLGNLVAGIAITIYKPFRLGDTLQVATPTGTETGIVDAISLGYTTLLASDGRHIVLPNSIAASQVSLNLSHRAHAASVSFSIEISRQADLASVRTAALSVVESLVENSKAECFVKRIDQQLSTLEIRFYAPIATLPETARTKVMEELSRRLSAESIEQFALIAT